MTAWKLLGLVAAAAAYLLTDAVGSSMALADLAGRPVVALSREDGAVRVPVRQPGQAAQAREARVLGGTGVPFGYTTSFAMPEMAPVDCTARFRHMACTGGWTPLRADPAPRPR